MWSLVRIGADDYMPKPFSTRELTARVKALSDELKDPSSYRTRPNCDRGSDCSILKAFGEYCRAARETNSHRI